MNGSDRVFRSQNPNPNHIKSAEQLRQEAITEAMRIENWLEERLRDVRYIRYALEKPDEAYRMKVTK